MSKDLAKKDDKLDVLAGLQDLQEFKAGKGEQVEGLEVLDQSDLKLPKIKIAQLTSKEVSDGKVKPGQFFNTVTLKTYDSLPATLLVLGKSRVMWKEPFKRGEEPLCRSIDGRHRTDTQTPYPGTTTKCEHCPYMDWNKAQADGKNKPPCNMSYVWLGLTSEGENSTPFRFIASGMSVVPTKNFINDITPKKFPPFIYDVVLTTKKETNESGTYFFVQYEIVGAAKNSDEATQRQDMATGLRDMFMQAIQHDTSSFESDDIVSTEQSESEEFF